MIAHYTNGNVLTVKKLLGHKRIENTMKHISISGAFDYVTEKNSIMLFRRPKGFLKVCV